MAVALSKTVTSCSSGNQRSFTGVASRPCPSRSTWPAYRLPKRVIMLASFAVDRTMDCPIRGATGPSDGVVPLRRMTPDELLTTTRSVRRRLDLTRAVPRDLILECLDLAVQAPTGSNRQQWQWLVITEPATKRFIGERYRESWYAYAAAGRPEYPQGDPRREQTPRVVRSARYLADHMGEVPTMVIPCIAGRVDGQDNLAIAGLYGSIVPAVWSF